MRVCIYSFTATFLYQPWIYPDVSLVLVCLIVDWYVTYHIAQVFSVVAVQSDNCCVLCKHFVCKHFVYKSN